MAKRDLYKEALADANKIKQIALKNGMKVISENFKDVLKETVEAELNEEASDEDEEVVDEAADYGDEDTMAENSMDEDIEMDEEVEDDDLALDFDSDDLGDEDLEESAGFDEADLQEVLRQVLDEVDHGALGDMEEIDPDTHDTGLMDQDSKESGWEDKTPPAKKDWTVKESAYKQKIAKLVLENAKLKKGFKTLRESYREVETFNRKLFYLNKLLERKGVRQNEKLKRNIIEQLDGASTIEEAKTVYKSLNMAIGLVSEGNVSKKGKKTSTLSEALGSHSKNERGISSVKHDHLLNEDARFSKHRFQHLAGIVKDD